MGWTYSFRSFCFLEDILIVQLHSFWKMLIMRRCMQQTEKLSTKNAFSAKFEAAGLNTDLWYLSIFDCHHNDYHTQEPTYSEGHSQARGLQFLWSLPRTALWPTGIRALALNHGCFLRIMVTPNQNYGPKPGSETLEEARLREAREKVKRNLTRKIKLTKMISGWEGA